MIPPTITAALEAGFEEPPMGGVDMEEAEGEGGVVVDSAEDGLGKEVEAGVVNVDVTVLEGVVARGPCVEIEVVGGGTGIGGPGPMRISGLVAMT